MSNVTKPRLEEEAQPEALSSNLADDQSGLREFPRADEPASSPDARAFPLVSERVAAAPVDEEVWFDALPPSEGSIAPISFDEPPLRVRRKAPRRIAQGVIALAACAAGLVFVAEYETIKSGVVGLFGSGESAGEPVALPLAQEGLPKARAAGRPQAADRSSLEKTSFSARDAKRSGAATQRATAPAPDPAGEVAEAAPVVEQDQAQKPPSALQRTGTAAPAPQVQKQAIVASVATPTKANGSKIAGHSQVGAKPKATAADNKKADNEDTQSQTQQEAGALEAFDVSAANRALARSARLASMCGREGGPSGGGTVRVVYDPEGGTRATVLTPAFAGTEVGRCVELAFSSARTPAYRGGGLSSTYPFTVPY